jgi:hypothetical protein
MAKDRTRIPVYSEDQPQGSEVQTNMLSSAAVGRRGFIQSSSLAAILAAFSKSEFAAPLPLSPQEGNTETPFFTADRYTNKDVDELYGTGLAKRSGMAQATLLASNPQVSTQHMIFYYDRDAKMMINPGNVKPALKAAKYSLDLKILNSHVSRSDFDTIWKNLKNDAHLQLSLTTPSSEAAGADDLMWTLMNGIDIFLGGKLEGVDQRLKHFVTQNQPTSKFRPSEKVEILKGTGFFQLQLAAQKKESWWKKLLTILGAALDSPLFATLPIPKLLPEAVSFSTAVLNQIKKTEPLVPVWQSAGIPFVLYDGATPGSDFKLRPGRWLTIDRTYAEAHLDEQSNLKDHVIDVLGEFNEVKTKAGQPIDANYAVLELDFPALAS